MRIRSLTNCRANKVLAKMLTEIIAAVLNKANKVSLVI